MSKHFVKTLAGADLSWADYGKMQCKRIPEMRHKVPPWARDDAKVRAVILERMRRYCRTAGVFVPEVNLKTLIEKYRVAHEKFATMMVNSNTGRMKISVFKHMDFDPAKVAAREAAVIHFAYRMHYDSVKIAQELGYITPLHVRQILARQNKVARDLFPNDCLPMRDWGGNRSRGEVKVPRALRPYESRTNSNSRAKSRYAQLRAQGLCTDACGRPARPGGGLCQQCADATTARRVALLQRRAKATPNTQE